MKYQEKIKLAEQIVNLFKEGKDYSFIENWIVKTGLKKYDVDKVMFSAKKMLKTDYLDQILPSLEVNNEEKINQILSKLSPVLIKDIKLEGINELKKRLKAEINNRVKCGDSDENITENLKTWYFTEDDIRDQISFYKKYNEAPKGAEKDKLLLMGVPFLIIGLLMALFVKPSSGRPSSIAFLLILYGGWNIYKAFTPPGVSELSDLNDRFK